MTSSQSPEGDGIPTLAGRVSCFVGESFTCAVAATSQRFRLHRHWLSASPAVASQSGNHHETWFSSRGKRKRECTVVKRGSVFTQGTLPWNLQALFCCQSTTCILAQDRTNINKMCICGCLSFLPRHEWTGVFRKERP